MKEYTLYSGMLFFLFAVVWQRDTWINLLIKTAMFFFTAWAAFEYLLSVGFIVSK